MGHRSVEPARELRLGLLIRRDTGIGLSSAQVGWLEGDLYELLSACPRAVLSNLQKPGDDTLPPYELRILESFRRPDQQGAPPARLQHLHGRRRDPAGGHVQDKAANAQVLRCPAGGSNHGRPRVGRRHLVSMQALYPATASVGEGGTVVLGGVTYPKPSAAAVAVPGKETNGWDFWAVKGDTDSRRLSAIRKRYQDSLPAEVPSLT